jgi:hypothetical protein
LNGAFVRGSISLSGLQSEGRQAALWEDRVRLDEGFWASLQEHQVPIRKEAIFALGRRSMAMDVYIWLAYRLHALTKPTPVTWAAVQGQFAAGYKDARFIRSVFMDAVYLALAVYPKARADIDEKRGVILLDQLLATGLTCASLHVSRMENRQALAQEMKPIADVSWTIR